jgi:hypothetical protein
MYHCNQGHGQFHSVHGIMMPCTAQTLNPKMNGLVDELASNTLSLVATKPNEEIENKILKFM